MTIRDATDDDYDAYVRLLAELGLDDPVPSRERFVAELRARTIVAEDAGGVVGYTLVEHMPGLG